MQPSSLTMPPRLQKYFHPHRNVELPNIDYKTTPYDKIKIKNKSPPHLVRPTIYGVYFICCIGDYKRIVLEQLSTLWRCGLAGKTMRIFCFICKYDPKIMEILGPFMEKLKIISTTENLYEKFAFMNFREHLPSTRPFYLYYFHTKGVSRTASVFHETRKNLDYFILEKHEICIFWLDHGYDAVGASLALYPSLHFSGNFWWAKSSHLQDLPLKIRNTYYAPEMYVCSLPKGRYISICQHTNSKPLKELSTLSDDAILKQSTCIPNENVACRNMVF